MSACTTFISEYIKVSRQILAHLSVVSNEILLQPVETNEVLSFTKILKCQKSLPASNYII